MFGVVLWSDQVRNRAVIWCEDHGDLAFFNGEGFTKRKGVGMDPGDLVHFDVREDKQVRLAHNPRLVSSDEYPTLASDLQKAGAYPDRLPRRARMDGQAKVVAFEPRPANASHARKSARRAVGSS